MRNYSLLRTAPSLRVIRERWIITTLLLVAVVGLCSAPYLVSAYLLLQLALVGVFAIGGFGLVVLTGHAGQFNLGFAGLMALGAYTAAILQEQSVPFVAALGAALVVGLLAGAIIGVFSRWLSEFSMAIVTFALGIFVNQVVTWADDLTGGLGGIAVGPADIDLATVYYQVLICVVVSALVAFLLLRGWVGRAFRGVRDNPIAAEQMGLPLGRTKLFAYLVSTPFATLTGALYAQSLGYIAPSAFNVELSLAFLVIVIVGGMASLWGAALGAVIWVAVPELTADLIGLGPIIFGVLTLAVLLLSPTGLSDVPRRIRRLVLARASAATSVRAGAERP